MQIIEGDERESSREIPPKDVNGGAGVLRGANNMHHWGVKRKGWRDMYLNDDQGVMMDLRAPLKVMEHTNKERGRSKTGI